GLFSEGRDWLDRALRTRTEHHQTEARALATASELALEQGDFAAASRLVTQCKTIASAEVGDVVLGRAAIVEAWLAHRSEDHATLAKAACSAIETLEPRGASKALSEAWSLLAWSESSAGNWEQAQSHLEKACEIAVRSGDLTAEAERLGDLATCYRWVSDLQSARSLAERALTLARRVGIQHLAGLLLGWLAHFSADEGDGRTALRLSNEAVSIAEELGIPEHRLFALFAKARALRLISRDEAARELLNDLLAQYEFKYGKAFGAEVTEELASLEKTTGNTYRAVVLWAAAT